MNKLSKEETKVKDEIIRQLNNSGSFKRVDNKQLQAISHIVMCGKDLYKGQEKK